MNFDIYRSFITDSNRPVNESLKSLSKVLFGIWSDEYESVSETQRIELLLRLTRKGLRLPEDIKALSFDEDENRRLDEDRILESLSSTLQWILANWNKLPTIRIGYPVGLTAGTVGAWTGLEQILIWFDNKFDAAAPALLAVPRESRLDILLDWFKDVHGPEAEQGRWVAEIADELTKRAYQNYLSNLENLPADLKTRMVNRMAKIELLKRELSADYRSRRETLGLLVEDFVEELNVQGIAEALHWTDDFSRGISRIVHIKKFKSKYLREQVVRAAPNLYPRIVEGPYGTNETVADLVARTRNERSSNWRSWSRD